MEFLVVDVAEEDALRARQQELLDRLGGAEADSDALLLQLQQVDIRLKRRLGLASNSELVQGAQRAAEKEQLLR